MAMHPGFLTAWPWERLGSFKYVLYAPLVASAIHANLLGGTDVENLSFHLMLLAILRYIQGQLWMTVTRFPDLVRKHRVQQKNMRFEQLDREENWEDYILFQALFFYVYQGLQLMQIHPLWDWRGFVVTVFWHIGPVEFIYYWFHRLLHHHHLYRRYHSHHHSSFLTQAVTGNVHPFAEHIAYAWLFGSTFIVNSYLGTGSIALIYFYTLWFDFMNCIGHCNWEFLPEQLFKAFPPLKYLVYTPSFHSLHHTQVHTNFCLFMPIYDYLYGTVDKTSDELYLSARKGRTETVDCIFLTHPTDPLSILHYFIGLPSFSSRPYARRWYIWLLYPLAVPLMLLLWAFGETFTVDEYMVEKTAVQIWAVPRFSFHYTCGLGNTNKLIERAILAAEKKGAKVICLGMHNKDQELSGSFLRDLSIRVVDGSAMTTFVVVNKLPEDVREVFLTGVELKIGRAIASYLCIRRLVTVRVLSSGQFDFEVLKNAVPLEFHDKLVPACSFEDGSHCKHWIVGKPLDVSKQMVAPSGTNFYQFTEDIMDEIRSDCTYSKLPGMHLPPECKGPQACEVKSLCPWKAHWPTLFTSQGRLPRGVMHASHAGGVVAALEGWTGHEVGPHVDIDLVDQVMGAAMDHRFRPHY